MSFILVYTSNIFRFISRKLFVICHLIEDFFPSKSYTIHLSEILRLKYSLILIKRMWLDIASNTSLKCFFWNSKPHIYYSRYLSLSKQLSFNNSLSKFLTVLLFLFLYTLFSISTTTMCLLYYLFVVPVCILNFFRQIFFCYMQIPLESV